MKKEHPLMKNVVVQLLVENVGKDVTCKLKSDGTICHPQIDEVTDCGNVKCSIQYEGDTKVYKRIIPINRIEYVEVETDEVWEEEEDEAES